jgi:hypothetical protein
VEKVVVARLHVIKVFDPADPKMAEDKHDEDDGDQKLERLHYVFDVDELHDLVVVLCDVIFQVHISHQFVTLDFSN